MSTETLGAETLGAETSHTETLAALRQAGAQRLDPARFHFMEQLAGRLQTASAALRPLLADKLAKALADYAQRQTQAQQAASADFARLASSQPTLAPELRRLYAVGDYRGLRRRGAQAAGGQACAPLAQLNQYIRQASRGESQSRLGIDAPASSEMKSVQRFRQTWSRISAEDQVEKAAVRGPENAGPLNSHMLVLRSLALMQKLSPDYLRHFMAHADTLLWLDQANRKYALVPAKAARRGRHK